MHSESAAKGFFSAILFDMDGTLVDSEPLWLASEEELTARYGYEWTQSDQAHCLGGPLDRVGTYMFELTGAQSPEYFTQSLIDLMAQKLRSQVALMPGAEPLLELCRALQLPIALVSASPRVLVDAVLAHPALHRFDVSISSNDVSRVKPHPEGYLKAAQILQVPISGCLILEDSATGVEAARASGGWVVAVPHIVEISPGERVRIVSSVSELTHSQLQSYYSEMVTAQMLDK